MQADFNIGKLRFPVTLCSDTQSPDPLTAGIIHTYTNLLQIHACIEPVTPFRTLYGIQVDLNRITHRITIRWTRWLDEFKFVLREYNDPDGSIATDVYRIHAQMPAAGRERFIEIDAELIETV